MPPQTCPSCRHPVPQDALFCEGCGRPVADPPAPADLPTPPPAPLDLPAPPPAPSRLEPPPAPAAPPPAPVDLPARAPSSAARPAVSSTREAGARVFEPGPRGERPPAPHEPAPREERPPAPRSAGPAAPRGSGCGPCLAALGLLLVVLLGLGGAGGWWMYSRHTRGEPLLPWLAGAPPAPSPSPTAAPSPSPASSLEPVGAETSVAEESGPVDSSEEPTWGGQPLVGGDPADVPGIVRISDQEAVEQLARLGAPIRADEVHGTVAGRWGFVDVAQQNADTGEWESAVAAVFLKEDGRWRLLEWGDPMEWGHYRDRMTPEEAEAFEQWQGSHL